MMMEREGVGLRRKGGRARVVTTLDWRGDCGRFQRKLFLVVRLARRTKFWVCWMLSSHGWVGLLGMMVLGEVLMTRCCV